ncbi:MAG: ATP-binding protein [Oscillospiraceae bacterium]|nr:ATP-binding protein [Oscillospiraceae bacterium]
MALDGKLLGRALDRLEELNKKDERELNRLRERVYARLPRVAQIDRTISQSFAEAAFAALDSGSANPEEALRNIALKNLNLQAERAELMSEAGFAPDCLDEKPRCEKCSDRGFYGTKPCTCLMELYKEEQRLELSQLLKLGEETFDSFNLDYYDDRPMKDGVVPRDMMEVIYEICLQYARRFGDERENLFMTGGPGLGKTFLSTCIAKVVSENGFSVVYDTAVNVFAHFEEERFARSYTDMDSLRADLDRYMNCDLLILDDLGTEMTTSFTISALYDLVNTRLRTGKKTIINSNLSIEDIRRRYSVQIASRLQGEYTVLSFVGRDIRQKKNH